MVCGTCERSSFGWELPAAVCNSSARLSAHPLPGLAQRDGRLRLYQEVPGSGEHGMNFIVPRGLCAHPTDRYAHQLWDGVQRAWSD